MGPFSGASEKPLETGDVVFQHIPINVLPKVAEDPIAQLEPGVTLTTQDVSDEPEYQEVQGFAPQPDPFDFREPEVEAAVTLDECKDVTMMIVNIPGMFGMSHLARDEQQCAPFAKELHKYCERKGLDPRDWFFEEMGMCLTGFGLIGGMYKDHREYKKEHPKKSKKVDVGTGVEDSYSRSIPEPEDPPEARPEDATLTEGVGMIRR